MLTDKQYVVKAMSIERFVTFMCRFLLRVRWSRNGNCCSIKKTLVLCVSRNPRRRTLHVSGNTLQQVKFKYLGVVFASDDRRSEEIDARIGKASALLRELIALWTQNGSFQTTQSLHFLNQSLFRTLHMVMNLGLFSKKFDPKYRPQKCFFLGGRVNGVTLPYKVLSYEIRKPWMSNHFSESKDLRYVGSRRNRPRCLSRMRWSDCISDLAWSGLDVQPAELPEISVDR